MTKTKTRKWDVTIDTPDYETVIEVELPEDWTEAEVRTHMSKYFTVYEIIESEDDQERSN